MISLARRDTPPQALTLVTASGSFAAMSFIFASPLIAAVILIEATAIGGARLRLLLVPGLLAAGIGSLVSLGIGSLSGLSTHDYALGPIQLPTLGHLTGSQFGWTIALAIAVAVVTSFVMRGGLLTYQFVSRRQMLLLLPAIGLIIGGLAIAFTQITGKGVDEVLFSGQDQLPGLIGQAGTWSVGALAWLIVFKGLAYMLSLGSYRGGPDVPGALPGGRRGNHVLASPGLPTIGSRAGRDGRRDRRRAPAAALSGRARDAADVARRGEGRAADHRRRRRLIRRDARRDTPAGADNGAGGQSRSDAVTIAMTSARARCC